MVPSRPQLGSAGRTPCDAPLGAGGGVAAPSRLFPPRPEQDVPAGRQQGVGAPVQTTGSEERNQLMHGACCCRPVRALEEGQVTWFSAPEVGCAADCAWSG